jgi:hypothetical protein
MVRRMQSLVETSDKPKAKHISKRPPILIRIARCISADLQLLREAQTIWLDLRSGRPVNALDMHGLPILPMDEKESRHKETREGGTCPK